MRARIVSVFCVCMVLIAASTAYGQVAAKIKAGSDEDKAFRKISAEKSQEAQAQLLQEFVKQFPQSPALPQVWSMLMDIASEKNDHAKITEYGEQVLKADPQNVTALVTVSRIYAMDGKNLEVAVSYAQKAVENVDKMKAQPVPPNYSDAEWKDLIKQNEVAAKGQLDYAKAVKN
jgi:cytochrome c-type biogenesis protein CcmH/NrfG